MRPRYLADYRTILWVLLTPAVVAVQYARPELIPYLFWVSCYFATSCGVIAHNHNHSPTFHNKRTNAWFANWISVFWGYPTFAWIPTHNLNHHKYVNAEGDATITWRLTNKHNALVAATYFFVSGYYQQAPTKEFLAKTKAKRPDAYRRIVGQYLFWMGSYVTSLGVACALHGFKSGTYVFVMTIGIPALVALWSVHLINYEQHVHTNPWSEYDHSRNFVSRILNFFIFNNGYHTAHHENPGLHWSQLPQAHALIAAKIDPVLNQRSLGWYWFKQYVLAVFKPSLGTVQLGPGPHRSPTQSSRTIETAEVDVGEAGANAVRSRASVA